MHGKMASSWETRYEEQAERLRVLVRELARVREIRAKLESGLRTLLEDRRFRTLLDAEEFDHIPVVLTTNRATRQARDRTTDPRFDQLAPEAGAILRSTSVGTRALDELARLTSRRQVQAARLMLASGCVSFSYANALVCATVPEMFSDHRALPTQRIDPVKRRAASEEITRLDKQLAESMRLDNSDLLWLLVVCNYAVRLLLNSRLGKYLYSNWPDVRRSIEWAVQSYWESDFIQFGLPQQPRQPGRITARGAGATGPRAFSKAGSVVSRSAS
jgi:hypothetical protein